MPSRVNMQHTAARKLLFANSAPHRDAYEPGLKCVTALGKRMTAESTTRARDRAKPGSHVSRCDCADGLRQRTAGAGERWASGRQRHVSSERSRLLP